MGSLKYLAHTKKSQYLYATLWRTFCGRRGGSLWHHAAAINIIPGVILRRSHRRSRGGRVGAQQFDDICVECALWRNETEATLMAAHRGGCAFERLRIRDGEATSGCGSAQLGRSRHAYGRSGSRRGGNTCKVW